MKNLKNSIILIWRRRPSRLFFLLTLTTLFNFGLLAFRLDFIQFDFTKIENIHDLARHRGIPTFMFLVWNLFLAWIPFWLSLLLEKVSFSKILTGICLLFWLLFLPNAPYIVTDLLHLKFRPPVPFWFDLMLIFSFAWTGLLLGFASLLKVQQFLSKSFPKFIVTGFTTTAIFLCGFGVYIGRFQRWNSWDIFANPFALMMDMMEVLWNPLAYVNTLGIAVVLSILLGLGFLTLKTLSQSKI